MSRSGQARLKTVPAAPQESGPEPGGRIEAVDRSLGGVARDHVYLALREAIVSAQLAPGLRLSENELAGELGVSRTPVREALQRLREERLVAIVPQLGTFVTLISLQAVADASFVREALECSAIALAATRAHEADLEELRANLLAQERAHARGDEHAFDQLDDDLHRKLCELSGHAIAWALSRRANGHLDRVRRLSLPAPGYLSEMISEHQAIVAAVAEGDSEAAQAAMRHHLRMVPSSLPQLRRSHPDHFEEG